MSGAPDLTPSGSAPSIPDVAYVISALKGAADWHAEQGRPYSEQTDRDAIAFIVHLSNCNRDLVEALEQCAESLAFARDKLGYVGEGDHKDRKGDGTDPTGSFNALSAAREAINKANGAASNPERSGT